MTIILPDNRKPQPPATVLRGPADADAFRVKVGRYGERWYTDSLPACPIAPASEANHPSVSAVKKAKPFEGADYVAMKRIAASIVNDGPPWAATGAPEQAALYENFKTINKLGLDAAGKRGTDVHRQFELGLYGKPFQPGGPGSHYLPAIEAFFDAYQPTLVAAELVCIQRDLNGIGYGGTADAIVDIDGKTYLVDWKSRSEDGDHAAYPEEGAQLAAYATADYMIGEGTDGMAKRLPIPALDGLLIVSVKPDGCRIYPIDLDKAAPYFHTLHGWWCARREERSVIGRPWPTKTVAVDPGRGSAAEDGGVEAVDAASASPADPFDNLVPSDGGAPALARRATWTATMPDESELVDGVDTLLGHLAEAYAAQTDKGRQLIDSLLAAADTAGVPFGAMKHYPTMRRFEATRVAFAIAKHMWSETENVARAAIEQVWGDRPEVHQAPLGALIGSMTATELRQLHVAIEDYGDGKFEEDWSSFPMRLNRAA